MFQNIALGLLESFRLEIFNSDWSVMSENETGVVWEHRLCMEEEKKKLELTV